MLLENMKYKIKIDLFKNNLRLILIIRESINLINNIFNKNSSITKILSVNHFYQIKKINQIKSLDLSYKQRSKAFYKLIYKYSFPMKIKSTPKINLNMNFQQINNINVIKIFRQKL